MTLEQLKNQLPDYAKDIRLNLSMIFGEEGAPDLTKNQLYAIALASAYAGKNAAVIASIETLAEEAQLSEAEKLGAKSAASIMAMNNIYYRFLHLSNDAAFAALPAKLRMNVIGNPGTDKIDFELNCLAVSAINGCGMCIESHTHALLKAGVSKLAIQSSIRVAAILQAVAQTLTIA